MKRFKRCKVSGSTMDLENLKDLKDYKEEQDKLIKESIDIFNKLTSEKDISLLDCYNLLEPIITRLAELQFLIPLSEEKAKIFK